MRKLGIFLGGITSSVISKNFDCTSKEHIQAFGSANLRVRYLGILAECLESKFGKEVYTNYEYINRLTSILCGFGVEKLEQIKKDHFLLITPDTFTNLDQCSIHQLKVLFNIAITPNVYGAPISWDRTVIRTLGRLFTVASIEEISEIEETAFKGLSPKTVKQLDVDQLNLLKQVNIQFELRSRREFWNIVGLSYKITWNLP